MREKRKDINHKINMLYRQLGKKIYEDLKDNQLNIKVYQVQKEKIDTLIDEIQTVDINMDNIEEIVEPVFNEEGLQMYKFCPDCRTGNHPDATTCVRCHIDL